jgi:hypothetical protein
MLPASTSLPWLRRPDYPRGGAILAGRIVIRVQGIVDAARIREVFASALSEADRSVRP